MTLGLYDSERRYRRRVWTGFIKFALFVAFVLVVAVFAYLSGVEQLKERDAGLHNQVNELSRQKQGLELEVMQLKDVAHTAEARASALEAQLQKEVPQGDLAKLMQLAADRLAAGVAPDRLAFVIGEAQNKRNCQPAETRRLQPSTQIAKSPNRLINVAGGMVTVVGEGVAMRDGTGGSEGWYDPTQPVTLHITPHGGKEIVVSGMLPLHQSVVIDSTEVRMTALPGAHSFIEVTADRCNYP